MFRLPGQRLAQVFHTAGVVPDLIIGMAQVQQNFEIFRFLLAQRQKPVDLVPARLQMITQQTAVPGQLKRLQQQPPVGVHHAPLIQIHHPVLSLKLLLFRVGHIRYPLEDVLPRTAVEHQPLQSFGIDHFPVVQIKLDAGPVVADPGLPLGQARHLIFQKPEVGEQADGIGNKNIPQGAGDHRIRQTFLQFWKIDRDRPGGPDENQLVGDGHPGHGMRKHRQKGFEVHVDLPRALAVKRNPLGHDAARTEPVAGRFIIILSVQINGKSRARRRRFAGDHIIFRFRGQQVIAAVLQNDIHFGIIEHIVIFRRERCRGLNHAGGQLHTVHPLHPRMNPRRPRGLAGTEADHHNVFRILRQQDRNMGQQFHVTGGNHIGSGHGDAVGDQTLGIRIEQSVFIFEHRHGIGQPLFKIQQVRVVPLADAVPHEKPVEQIVGKPGIPGEYQGHRQHRSSLAHNGGDIIPGAEQQRHH